jgi:hypothetical protein
VDEEPADELVMSAITQSQRRKDSDRHRRSSIGHDDARPKNEPAPRIHHRSSPSVPIANYKTKKLKRSITDARPSADMNCRLAARGEGWIIPGELAALSPTPPTVSILTAVAGGGLYRGVEPRSNVSMMLM